VKRVVVLAPNWLGDAVMALPAMRDVAAAGLQVAVAARPPVAPLFALIPWVAETVVIERRPLTRLASLGAELRGRGFDAALVLPNSLHAAATARLGGIPERWGYRTDCRGPLLTRAIPPPAPPLHQAEYYQQLVRALGFPSGVLQPRIQVSDADRETGAAVLRTAGWDGVAPLVAVAPGAAYGSAKRWPADAFAAVVRQLAGGGVRAVLIGAAGDAAAAAAVDAALDPGSALNLVGATDLPRLAGVLANCRAILSNDSGAMHFAAAVGVSVVALFGPTDEQATAPLWNGSPTAKHRVVLHPVSCRPCMLRECPIDHRCMTGIDVGEVYDAVKRRM